MAYTNIWDDTKPTGSEPANTIDDLMRSMKVDIEQRFNDMFAMPSFATDPLRLYGLKFTDAQDAVINLGDNGGTPRNLVIKDKTGTTTYSSFGLTNTFSNKLTITQATETDIVLTNTTSGPNSWSMCVGSGGQLAIGSFGISTGTSYTVAANAIAINTACAVQIGNNTNGANLQSPGNKPLNLFGSVAAGVNSTVITLQNSANIVTAASGTTHFVAINSNAIFGPTSGTGIFNTLFIAPTINQTGGANGISRGIFISPVLTAAADWRAIEVTLGQTILQALTAGATGVQALTCTTLGNSGLITSSVDGRQYLRSGASTNAQWFDVGNTTGHLILGIESSTGGGLVTGTTAYATILATTSATPLQLATNGVLAVTIGTNQAVTLTSSLTATSASITLNQNATTSLTVTNTDVTNSTSRAQLSVVGGAITGIFTSIATDALYIGASTNSIVRFITNGAEKFRLDTSGLVTFQNGITINANGATISGGVGILTGGLTVTAGNTTVPNIKTTGASGIATVNNTNVTIVSFAGAAKGVYMFTATADTVGGAANCTTFIGVDGSGAITTIGQFTANANTAFSVSGTNIQYKQGSGGNLNITWTYTLLA